MLSLNWYFVSEFWWNVGARVGNLKTKLSWSSWLGACTSQVPILGQVISAPLHFLCVLVPVVGIAVAISAPRWQCQAVFEGWLNWSSWKLLVQYWVHWSMKVSGNHGVKRCNMATKLWIVWLLQRYQQALARINPSQHSKHFMAGNLHGERTAHSEIKGS